MELGVVAADACSRAQFGTDHRVGPWLPPALARHASVSQSCRTLCVGGAKGRKPQHGARAPGARSRREVSQERRRGGSFGKPLQTKSPRGPRVGGQPTRPMCKSSGPQRPSDIKGAGHRQPAMIGHSEIFAAANKKERRWGALKGESRMRRR
jgi:hypothetical protein